MSTIDRTCEYCGRLTKFAYRNELKTCPKTEDKCGSHTNRHNHWIYECNNCRRRKIFECTICYCKGGYGT